MYYVILGQEKLKHLHMKERNRSALQKYEMNNQD